jgi:hypothetical protein
LNAFCPGEVVTARVTLPASGDFFELQSPVGTVVGGPTATPGSLSFTITSFSPTAITARLLSPTFGGSVTFTCIAPGEDGGSEVKFWDPGDDRINREPGQPAALYCRNKGDLHVYAINVDNSKGILGLVVTKAEIDAVISGNLTTNALVKQSADGKLIAVVGMIDLLA